MIDRFTRAVRQSDGSFAPPSIDLWLLPQSFLTGGGEATVAGLAGDVGYDSPSFALLLQVGYILALTRKRKYGLSASTLRVIDLVDSAAGPGSVEETERTEALQATLTEARIEAEIKVVFAKLPPSAGAASIQSGGAQQLGEHVNSVIKSHSSTTVVSMMHLVRPPSEGASVDQCGDYIENLAALTNGLPISMLVATGQQESIITTQI